MGKVVKKKWLPRDFIKHLLDLKVKRSYVRSGFRHHFIHALLLVMMTIHFVSKWIAALHEESYLPCPTKGDETVTIVFFFSPTP